MNVGLLAPPSPPPSLLSQARGYRPRGGHIIPAGREKSLSSPAQASLLFLYHQRGPLITSPKIFDGTKSASPMKYLFTLTAFVILLASPSLGLAAKRVPCGHKSEEVVCRDDPDCKWNAEKSKCVTAPR